MLFNFVFYFLNFIFLFIGFSDANRRFYMMEKLSQSLEFDFHRKNSISVRLPTINFLDIQTLLSWLEARRLTLELGNRFQTRIQLYISYYIVLDALMLVLLFALGSKLISGDIMSTKAWIVFSLNAIFLTTSLLAVLLPYSYINR